MKNSLNDIFKNKCHCLLYKIVVFHLLFRIKKCSTWFIFQKIFHIMYLNLIGANKGEQEFDMMLSLWELRSDDFQPWDSSYSHRFLNVVWLMVNFASNSLNYMSRMCIYCSLIWNCTINIISLAHSPSYVTVTYRNKPIPPPIQANKITPTLVVKSYVNWSNTNKYGNLDCSLSDLTIPQHHCNQDPQNWKSGPENQGAIYLMAAKWKDMRVLEWKATVEEWRNLQGDTVLIGRDEPAHARKICLLQGTYWVNKIIACLLKLLVIQSHGGTLECMKTSRLYDNKLDEIQNT